MTDIQNTLSGDVVVTVPACPRMAPDAADTAATSPHYQVTVVNELLCYISCMRDTVPHDDLAALVCDFYNEESITTARDVFYDLLPEDRPSRLRKTKCKSMKDNVSNILKFMHETPKDVLPLFVVGDVRNIPTRDLLSTDAVSLQSQCNMIKEDMQTLKREHSEQSLQRHESMEEIRRIQAEQRSLLELLLARFTMWDKALFSESHPDRVSSSPTRAEREETTPAAACLTTSEGEAHVTDTSVVPAALDQEEANSLPQVDDDTPVLGGTSGDDTAPTQDAEDVHTSSDCDTVQVNITPDMGVPAPPVSSGEMGSTSRTTGGTEGEGVMALISSIRATTYEGGARGPGGSDVGTGNVTSGAEQALGTPLPPPTYARVVVQSPLPSPAAGTNMPDTSPPPEESQGRNDGNTDGEGFTFPRRRRNRRRRGRQPPSISATTSSGADPTQPRLQAGGQGSRPGGQGTKPGNRLGPPPTCQVLVRGFTPQFPVEEVTTYVHEMLGDASVQVSTCWRRRTAAFVITAGIRHRSELLSCDNWEDHIVVQPYIPPKQSRVPTRRGNVGGDTVSSDNDVQVRQ